MHFAISPHMGPMHANLVVNERKKWWVVESYSYAVPELGPVNRSNIVLYLNLKIKQYHNCRTLGRILYKNKIGKPKKKQLWTVSLMINIENG